MRSRPTEAVGEAAGWFAGWTIAPLVRLLTRLRGTRLLHAEGAAYHAVVVPDAGLNPGEERRLACGLAGPALVRLSAAFWRGREWRDVLGLAIRFYGANPAGYTDPGVQDLLLATASSVLGLGLGLVRTDPHDFLANEYDGLAGIVAEGIGPVRLRAVWGSPSPPGGDRRSRLAAAVEQGQARFRLRLRAERSTEWRPLLDVELREPAGADDRSLSFWPFRAEAGLRPAGFWQVLRMEPYRAACVARGASVPAEPAASPRARRHPRMRLLARRLRRAGARASFRRRRDE